MAILFGTNGNNTFDAAHGVTNDSDFIDARDGTDTIFGLGGNDWIIGGKGADYIDGGAGTDLADYSDSNAAVVVSLRQHVGIGGSAGGDALWNIEDLQGSGFSDMLVGDDNVNWLWGQDGNDELKGWGGNDVLIGGAGNDRLQGGAGADTLNGGTGIDTAEYGKSPNGVVVDLRNGVGHGNDAEGDTYVSIENVTGSHHNDTIYGNNQNNVINGQAGHDDIDAGGGADTVNGGGGNDTLWGANGDDTLDGSVGEDNLRGGYGRDNLYGGSGADDFVWGLIDETGTSTVLADCIWDFSFAQGDQIRLSEIDANVYAFGNQAFTFIGTDAFSGTPGEVRYYQSGGNTYIEMQTGTSVDVEGVIRLAGIHTPEGSWFIL